MLLSRQPSQWYEPDAKEFIPARQDALIGAGLGVREVNLALVAHS
jgi:hypothetical protein